tara:strand:- start:566 stop:934 length:369 start_codon:yes stop_codon:yes gene_type:complete
MADITDTTILTGDVDNTDTAESITTTEATTGTIEPIETTESIDSATTSVDNTDSIKSIETVTESETYTELEDALCDIETTMHGFYNIHPIVHARGRRLISEQNASLSVEYAIREYRKMTFWY